MNQKGFPWLIAILVAIVVIVVAVVISNIANPDNGDGAPGGNGTGNGGTDTVAPDNGGTDEPLVTPPENLAGNQETVTTVSGDFSVTVSPASATLEGEDSIAEFLATFTYKGNSTVYIPESEATIGFTDICRQNSSIGLCSSEVKYPTEPNVCGQHALSNGDSIQVWMTIGSLSGNPSQSEFPMNAWIKYKDNPGQASLAEMETSESSQFHLRTSGSQIETQGVQLQGIPCEVRGMQGFTGQNALPKMIFSWDWGDIYSGECDLKDGENFCDATQFSISLFRKLKGMEQYIDSGEEIPIELLGFDSFLKKDSFSEAFKKDFAYYYTHEFFSTTPEWFTEWEKYYSEEKIEFSPKTISEPGIYSVKISIPDASEGFFENGEPNKTLTISFEKSSEPFTYSPLLEIPSTLGDNPLNILEINEFAELNWNERGKALEISQDSLKLFKSEPVSVLMGIEGSTEQPIGAFYRVINSQQENIIPKTPYFTEWAIVHSSPELNCKDFSSETIESDYSAESFTESCVLSNKNSAFGHWWNSGQEGRLLLHGVIYVPTGSSNYSLMKECGSGFFSVNGEIEETISLGNTEYSVSTIEEAVQLVRDEKVCVVSNGNEFHWMEEALYIEPDALLSADTAWGSGSFSGLADCAR